MFPVTSGLGEGQNTGGRKPKYRAGGICFLHSVQEERSETSLKQTSCCCLCVQVKEQMLLLEAQLEKQTDNQVFSEEMEQVYD